MVLLIQCLRGSRGRTWLPNPGPHAGSILACPGVRPESTGGNTDKAGYLVVIPIDYGSSDRISNCMGLYWKSIPVGMVATLSSCRADVMHGMTSRGNDG